MGKADGLSRRPDWEVGVERDNEEQTEEEHVQQGIAREVYGKIIIWMGGEEIQAGVLEKVRKKLAVMKEESIC